MNKPIRRVSVFCLILVLALLLRANWVQGVVASSYASNPNNARNLYDQYAYPRGNIYAGGQVITRSDFVNGYRFKYKRGYSDGAMYAPSPASPRSPTSAPPDWRTWRTASWPAPTTGSSSATPWTP